MVWQKRAFAGPPGFGYCHPLSEYHSSMASRRSRARPASGTATSRGADRAIRLRYRLGGASAYLGLAGDMARTGRPERVLALYREAADIDGGSAEARAGAARMRPELGQFEAAVPEYRRAIELDPRSARAHLGLAKALSTKRMTTEAQRAYERAVELDPGIDKGRYESRGGGGA